MWNIVDPSGGMGHSSPMWGPSIAQKRNLHFNFPNLAIAPGKCFNNPNFVNKNNPSILNYHNNYLPFEGHCQIDNFKKDNIIKDSTAVNSSNPSEGVDIIQDQINISEPINQNFTNMCCSKKSTKRNRRNRRRKRQSKNSKHNKKQREMYELMEEDLEFENSVNNSVMTSNSSIPNNLCLEDFIVELSDSHNSVQSNCNNCEIELTVGSATPPSICFLSGSTRKRQSSVTESEDSFIVFDSGTDDELDFSEETENESEMDEDDDSVTDEESESENEEDIDSSSSVIPTKRVRFADGNELCEVHPMVQWAYAYKQARKGPWEVYARDRSRFKKRVDETETILMPILDCKHREKVFEERFQHFDKC